MKGSTLIETLIYIGMLAVLMLGVFSSAYVLMGTKPVEDRTELLLENYYE